MAIRRSGVDRNIFIGVYINIHTIMNMRRAQRAEISTLRSSVCAYTLLRRVLIHADCKWPSPTSSTTLPLYEMIACFIETKLPLGQDFQRNATVFKWGQCTKLAAGGSFSFFWLFLGALEINFWRHNWAVN